MTSASSQLAGHRLLIVEDNLLVADLLCDFLTDRGFHVVGPCARLARALALVAEAEIDGAFLDVNLAGEYCFPLADLLRQRGVPFAFLTGYGESTVIPKSFDDVPVLSKPFHPPDLVGVMARHFGPSFSRAIRKGL
jgi:CheY-like chemotaxis protein